MKSLAKDQLCHVNEGWLPAYCGACDGGSGERKKRKKDKERERQRQNEVEGAIQRTEVAAMVTSITHTHTNTHVRTMCLALTECPETCLFIWFIMCIAAGLFLN